jgi:hypothetical protein
MLRPCGFALVEGALYEEPSQAQIESGARRGPEHRIAWGLVEGILGQRQAAHHVVDALAIADGHERGQCSIPFVSRVGGPFAESVADAPVGGPPAGTLGLHADWVDRGQSGRCR